jgi:hypothetical protein
MAVCRMHGGKTPKGPALPQFRTGKFSKVLPVRLAAAYREAAKDPELLSLRSEIALLDARIIELLGRAETGESGALWDALQHAWAQFRRERASGDVQGMHAAMAHLDALMEQGLRDHLAWAEIGDAIEQRRKLVDSEQKRLVALRQVLSREQALTLIGVLTQIITKHIADRSTLAGIVADIQALTTQDAPAGKAVLRVAQ